MESSGFAQELRRLGVAYRFINAPVNLRYQSRAGLVFRVYPRLIARVTAAAWRSLRAGPDVVVVSSDIEALIFGLMRRVLRPGTRIVFQTLIVTPRRSALFNTIYLLIWRLILAVTDLGICHARAEVAAYARLFPRHAAKFVFIPYGTTVTDHIAQRSTSQEDGLIVTAGRSGRDYPLLARAIAGLPCRLLIICDVAAAVAGVAPSPQIEIARSMFDAAYVNALARSAFVVVPLALDDISAGQMVLLQASALQRAVIITRTATTVDYATDGDDALMVGLGDEAGWRAAIGRLLDDPVLRTRLAAAGAARFDREHSTEAYVRALIGAIAGTVGVPPA